CRLGTVEQHALGFVREDDLPGALIPQVYFDYLRRKSPGQLPRVFEHNRHDILSLVALAGWVAEAVVQAPAIDLGPDELAGLGRLWETADPERGEACYRSALERGLQSPARERVLARLAWREKRRARWDASRELWEAAARGARIFDARPWEEMAKIHEHRLRDFLAAQAVVTEAIEHARAHRAPVLVLDALHHRLERLTPRLARRTGRPPTLPAPDHGAEARLRAGEHFRIHRRGRRLARQHGETIVHGEVGHPQSRIRRGAPDVGSEHHIAEPPQTGMDLGLLLEHVKARAGNPAFLESLNERGLLDHGATGGVDQVRRLLHGPE